MDAVLSSKAAGYWGSDPGTSDTDVRVIRNGDIKPRGIQWDTLPERSLTASEVLKSRVRAGDILITTSGMCGQTAMITEEPHSVTSVTNFVRVLRFDTSQVHARYAFHFFRTQSFLDAIAPFVRGTTLKNLSTNDAFANVRIPLPSTGEQRRISEILDKADAVRSKRGDILARLDGLAEAVFHDMFRDEPASGVVGNLATRMRTGPFGSQLLHGEFVQEGVAVLGLDNVVGNEFRWAERRYITAEKYQKLLRYTVHPGDVLISIMGTTGRCVVVPEDIPLAINTKHICAISVDLERLHPIFLRAAFLWHPESREHLRRQTKGSIMDGLNMGIVKTMPVPVPSLSRQREFANVVDGIDTQRAATHRALAADAELLAATQSRAFRGEL